MNYRCYQITLREKHVDTSGGVRSVNWIFIIGAPAWRGLGEYMTLDKTFYSLHFKQDVVAASSYVHIFFLMAFLKEALIRNIV